MKSLPFISISCLLLSSMAISLIGCGEKPGDPVEMDPKTIEPGTETTAQIDRAIQRGRTYLLERQLSTGAWSTGGNTKGMNILRPVPGSHRSMCVAVTALCTSALLETSTHDDTAAAKAIDKATDFLLEQLPLTRRDAPTVLYNCWASGFGLETLALLFDWYKENPAKQQDILEEVNRQIKYLCQYESLNGGWAYLDFQFHKKPTTSATSFTTATVLIGLHDAKPLGVNIPKRLSNRAMRVLLRQRNPNFTYLYDDRFLFYRGSRGCKIPGSLGRSQACNLATRLWGDKKVTDEILRTWLDRLVRKNVWLSRARKTTIPHESFFAVAGYYYYYGHYYGARCMELLPAKEQAAWGAKLAALLIPKQEKDGCWWDYPLYDYHWYYGTALAVRALQRCQAAQEK